MPTSTARILLQVRLEAIGSSYPLVFVRSVKAHIILALSPGSLEQINIRYKC
jgi:hypothetical protein